MRRPDLVSHNMLQQKRKKTYKKSIHAVSVEDKYKMLQNMKRGHNKLGGTFGGQVPEREPSPNLVVSIDKQIKPQNSGQRFPHSQKDPILVRG